MIVKVNIILLGEKQSSRELLVFLVMMTLLGEIFKQKKSTIVNKSLRN